MPIDFSDHDPTWPAEAARSMAELRAHFPVIEHVGSTAIPGLAAKPVIDLMASTPDLDTVLATEAVLTDLGYVREETGMRNRLFYRRDTNGTRTHHLHVIPADNWDTRNERLLRDHLLAHPEAAAEYGALKRELAARESDGLAYTKGKTALIQKLIDREREARGLPASDVWED
ncbi:GrpB family protein [Umezawaea sp. Da 62-37]|uniref:GrpB family protein n=1 Tax=Umezawaea sp. Da 62-37 TaxID=3075927 RepID=UPI0028F716A0|nr:GrpB family protein [Umezawaea sp. Da 62-37]WNV84592.1 GrpB family protein [Umezawaea sp. Da 62-37]